MPILVERKLFKTGEGAIAVTLPKAWTNYYHLKPGDKVEIVGENELIIRLKNKPVESSL
jgi:antitoxin component of MazEF toxin-antitoxin module